MGRFAGKNLDASGVDFSDRIKGGGGGRGRRGYVAWSGDLELVNRLVLLLEGSQRELLQCVLGSTGIVRHMVSPLYDDISKI